jgi:hypothetical protein
MLRLLRLSGQRERSACKERNKICYVKNNARRSAAQPLSRSKRRIILRLSVSDSAAERLALFFT